jgi:hypothetical protein
VSPFFREILAFERFSPGMKLRGGYRFAKGEGE